MSIERAIERIEKWINENRGEFVSFGMNRALAILKEEAESPCKRCKHFGKKHNLASGKTDTYFTCLESSYSEGALCIYDNDLENLFEPKEADETEAH